MTRDGLRVLVIGGDSRFDSLARGLRSAGCEQIEVERERQIEPALERLGERPADAAIVDRPNPGKAAFATLSTLADRFPELPVLLLVSEDLGDAAARAIRAGAQDYLVRGAIDGPTLARAIRCAVERKRLENGLRRSHDRYALAARGASEGIWDWDLKTERLFFSAEWKEMLGFDGSEIGGRVEEWWDRVHPSDLDELKRAVSSHLTGRSERLQNEHRLRDARGRYRWMLCQGAAVRDPDGAAERLTGSLRDIDARKMSERRLLHEAMHDALTGIANWALLTDRLQLALARLRRDPEESFAVLFLDLDRFKRINDRLGHSVGDQLLIGVAVRLQGLLRPGDTVARLGGDEFAILAHGIRNPSDATRIAARIHGELTTPFQLEGHKVLTTTSVGIALCDPAYQSGQEMLRDADTAMYRAKVVGPGLHAIFDEEMHQRAVELLRMEADLDVGLREEQFELRYQPRVSLGSGRLEGFEALVRWEHPRRGLLVPAEFISLAEETGLIIPLGWLVLAEACGQMATWQKQLPDSAHLRMGVNLSERQFQHPELVDRLREVLRQTGLAPGHLRLEIPEAAIVSAADRAIERLRKLHELGVAIHIDDFGTGRSSLASLHRLPAHSLELDRRFVSWLDQREPVTGVADTVVALAHRLGLKVSAEGLETRRQLDQLQRLDCEVGQGYYFSQPLTSREARELIASRRSWN